MFPMARCGARLRKSAYLAKTVHGQIYIIKDSTLPLTNV
jgi:hypothetical protein